nr:aldo/keto reductase [Maliibacterium massiliense]
MQMRPFGSLGFSCSLMGLGTMRMPTLPQSGKMDRPECIRMIRAAIDAGVNYIDTAYPYHAGESEIVVGLALQDGYRQRTFLADKLPPWEIHSHADCMRILDEQLAKLKTDHIDFYLLHALDDDNWKIVQQYDLLGFLDEAKAAGKIRYAGFSFHAGLDLFRTIMDAYPFDFAQIQLNYLDSFYQAGETGLAEARRRGLPIVIMEPLKGGKLAVAPTPEIQAAWDGAPVHRNPIEWAFHYLGDLEGINVVLTGSSSMAQMRQSIEIFSDMQPGHLREAERAAIARVRALYNERIAVQCTGCCYCVPCPQGVDIPGIFRTLNDGMLSESLKRAREHYADNVAEKSDYSQCVACGACMRHCPQGLPIIETLKKAHGLLADA